MMTVAEVNREEWSSNRHLSISNQHLSTFLINRVGLLFIDNDNHRQQLDIPRTYPVK
jgi:hypothetical protein